jgi:D-amino-acid oxidase
LGGIAEPGEWGLNVNWHNYDPVREMCRRCVEFLPALATAEVDAAEPVRVGLRPFRQGGVRLERQAGTRLVHNYGHGGSGVTLSWGCAFEVADLVEGALEGAGLSLPHPACRRI